MKYGILAIMAVTMFFATIARADESKGLNLKSNDMAIYLLEETISQTKFTKLPFKTYKADAWYLKFLKYFSNAEYGFERKAFFPEHEMPDKKRALVTRFRLFDKPIFLTFSISQ